MERKTERLWIRNLRGDDWMQMKRIFEDFTQSRYAIYDAPFPETEQAVKALTERFAESGLFFGVFLPDEPEMIGYVCFHEQDEGYDLGYCFHSSVHGRGYAYEAVSAMLDDLAAERSVWCFTAGTALENGPSCALLKKLGFVCRSTEKLAFHKDSAGQDITFVGGNFVLQR